MRKTLIDEFRTIWREPLVHFLVIGALLFLAYELNRSPEQDAQKRILVSASQVLQLRVRFERTWMRSPSDAEMAGLVDSFVRDEVYFREALAMGLDKSDPLIRRRMRQKLEFLLEDLSAEIDPEDAELTAFLQAHADKFRTEPRVSFRQVYLNPEAHHDLAAAAGRMLPRLQAGGDPETLGDATLLADSFTLAPQNVIARSFGNTFAEEIVSMAPGGWEGPIYSGLGAHLVLVSERMAGRLPELAEVRIEVTRVYLGQRRQALMDCAYKILLAVYEVVVVSAPSGDVGK